MAQEKGYRPQALDDLKGQPKIQKLLRVYIKAAQMKNTTLEHTLITAGSGQGKITTAYIIANEMGKDLKAYSATAISDCDDMAEILLNLAEGDILFIDEIQKMPKKVQQMMYTAMEQFVADVNTDGFPSRVPLDSFTLIGCTDQPGQLTDAMRNRFPIQLKLSAYSTNAMTDIVLQAADGMDIKIDNTCASIIAAASRGVPRNANSYLRRINDFALVINNGKITEELIDEAFDIMSMNRYGLNSDDMRYLTYLCESTKAVGIDTISLSIGMDKTSIENTIEPYLLQEKMIYRSARGRVISDFGRQIVKESANIR